MKSQQFILALILFCLRLLLTGCTIRPVVKHTGITPGRRRSAASQQHLINLQN
ncbi:MAG: hypothetical protein J7545_06360 [Roseofilum sp. SBFL]|uniref:hypothetical protein n=1 Tax=unclassified Roseofilum TaxID=2620099 RepID=UPI001B154178|nr:MULTISPECIES: hypothetical protein [unclassified Roseofilum]MBP0011871.1 hypothetical protein [Roseofilum sp. SID3]MBP0025491.1 hypothetical protein [Roseofilum sp. SID2]MBP0041581.1 hypothetical protein [Roseofilum sp. SBFL]